MEPEPHSFNGLNGATGEYLLPPLTPSEISTANNDACNYVILGDPAVRLCVET